MAQQDSPPEHPAPEPEASEPQAPDTETPETEAWFDETWAKVHMLSPFVRGWLTVVAIPGIIFAYNWEMWADLWEAYQSGDLQQDFQRNPQWFLLGGGGLLLLFILIFGGFVLSWWFTRYKVTEEHVMVKSGIFVRQHRQARIDRVQAVDLRQPLLARFTGLAELKFEVAEGDGTAATLAFLKKAHADELRAEIMDLASGRAAWEAAQSESADPEALQDSQTAAGVDGQAVADAALEGAHGLGRPDHSSMTPAPGPSAPGDVAGTTGLASTAGTSGAAGADQTEGAPRSVAGAETAPPPSAQEWEREVTRVPTGRLIGSVLTGWGTIILAIMLGVVIGGAVVGLTIALSTGASSIDSLVDEIGDEVLPFVASSGLGFSVLVPAVIVTGTVYFQQINAGFGFTASMTKAGLRMRYGLLERTNQTVPPGRVHALQVQQPLLWRPFGWYKVLVIVAGYGAAETRSTLLPVGREQEVMAVAAEMFPDLNVDEPELVFTEGLTGKGQQRGFSQVPRRARLFDPIVWRRRGFLTTPTAVMLRDGRASRRLTMIPHERLQSLSLHQGPAQRLRRVATVHLHSPAGPFAARVKNQDLGEAAQLFAQESSYAAVARRFGDRNRWMLPEELAEFERKLTEAEAAEATGASGGSSRSRTQSSGMSGRERAETAEPEAQFQGEASGPVEQSR